MALAMTGRAGRAAVPGARPLLLDERVRRLLLGARRLPGPARAGAAPTTAALGRAGRGARSRAAQQDQRALAGRRALRRPRWRRRERRLLATPRSLDRGAHRGRALRALRRLGDPRTAGRRASSSTTRTSEKMVAVAPLDFLSGQVEHDAPVHAAALAGRAGVAVPRRGWASGTACWDGCTSPPSRSCSPAAAAAPVTWRRRTRGCSRREASRSRRWLARPRLAWVRPGVRRAPVATGAAIAPLALPRCPSRRTSRYARALGQAPEHGGAQGARRRSASSTPTCTAGTRSWRRWWTCSARFRPRSGGRPHLRPRLRRRGRRRPAGPPAAACRRRISGHNNYWLWGPRGWDGRVLIVVGGTEERMRAAFRAGRARGDHRMRALHALREQPAGVDRTRRLRHAGGGGSGPGSSTTTEDG